MKPEVIRRISYWIWRIWLGNFQDLVDGLVLGIVVVENYIQELDGQILWEKDVTGTSTVDTIPLLPVQI
jgi:hypothetical protein